MERVIVVEDISIHPPRAGRDLERQVQKMTQGISIHPPRAGRDPVHVYDDSNMIRFQSTLPVRGGTTLISCRCVAMEISIHPPRAGRDRWTAIHRRRVRYFNPPSPCGEGLSRYGSSVTAERFQSTLPVRGGTISWHRSLKMT